MGLCGTFRLSFGTRDLKYIIRTGGHPTYDAHLRTRRLQSSVLGKCRSVPPTIFVWFIPFQVFPYYDNTEKCNTAQQELLITRGISTLFYFKRSTLR